MAIKPPPPPWEVLQHFSELIGDRGLKGEMDKNVRAVAQAMLSRMDVVSREEFDAQTEVLARTRDKVTALEEQLAQMTRDLEAAVSGN